MEHRSVEQLKERIATRLRSVCSDMPEYAFQALVDRMARLQLKYESRRIDESVAILARVAGEE